MFCNTVRIGKFGDLSNLKKHLEAQHQTNNMLQQWLRSYDNRNNNKKPSLNIHKEFFQFLLYFISSNCAIEQIKESTPESLSCEKT